MKYFSQRSLLAGAFCLWPILFWASAGIPFVDGAFEELKGKAQQLGKPFFVYFYEADCVRCELMETHTFQDDDLVQLVDQHYLAAKVDIRSKNSQRWKMDFKIKTLPTTIFFDSKGQEKNRYELMLSQNMFRNILYFNLEKKIETVITPTAAPQPLLSTNNSAERDTSITKSNVVKLRLKLATDEEEAPSSPPEPTAVEKKKKTLYIVSRVPRLEVQVGYFGRKANAEKLANRLSASFSEPVSIYSETKGAKSMYRVVIGPVSGRPAANALLQKLKRSGYRGIIK